MENQKHAQKQLGKSVQDIEERKSKLDSEWIFEKLEEIGTQEFDSVKEEARGNKFI